MINVINDFFFCLLQYLLNEIKAQYVYMESVFSKFLIYHQIDQHTHTQYNNYINAIVKMLF